MGGSSDAAGLELLRKAFGGEVLGVELCDGGHDGVQHPYIRKQNTLETRTKSPQCCLHYELLRFYVGIQN